MRWAVAALLFARIAGADEPPAKAPVAEDLRRSTSSKRLDEMLAEPLKRVAHEDLRGRFVLQDPLPSRSDISTEWSDHSG
jgi:hypothetical protein